MQDLVVPSFKPSDVCAPTAAPQLVAMCAPYIIRFIQCIIVYRTTGRNAQVCVCVCVCVCMCVCVCVCVRA